MVTCNICNNNNFQTISNQIRDSKKHKIIKCNNCTHVQLYPKPSKLSYKKFYDNNRQIKNIKFNFKIKQLEEKSNFDVNRRLAIIKKKYSKKNKILEIGSGNGFLLKNMFNLGYDITGIEISRERRIISKKLSDAPVLDYDEFMKLNPSSCFDLVLLFQVLEHIIQPVDFLIMLKKFLKKNGTIMIEIPNVNDFQLNLNQSYQNWFWQKAHINYFSSSIIRRILERSKFKEISIKGIQRYSIENMFYWKLINKPQPIKPTYKLPSEYTWIENHYKKYLQNKLMSDTLLITAKKI